MNGLTGQAVVTNLCELLLSKFQNPVQGGSDFR